MSHQPIKCVHAANKAWKALKCSAPRLPALVNLQLKLFQRAKETTTHQAAELELLISFQTSSRVRGGIVGGGSSTTTLDGAQGQHARLNNCRPFFMLMLLMLHAAAFETPCGADPVSGAANNLQRSNSRPTLRLHVGCDVMTLETNNGAAASLEHGHNIRTGY